MTSQELINALVDEIVNKELEPHGITIEDVRGENDWFQKYTMTPEENAVWVEWGAKLIQKRLKMSIVSARREMQWVNLNFGLREIRHEEPAR
jgi:hypothetical protein